MGAFGDAIAGVGDIDRDGYADLAVSHPTLNNVGRVYVHRGGPTGLRVAAPYTVDGADPASRFGASLGARGDIDGDGFPDLLVGADGFDGDDGRVYVFRGVMGGVESAFWRRVDGPGVAGRFGYAL
jgi:hypothetical protein